MDLAKFKSSSLKLGKKKNIMSLKLNCFMNFQNQNTTKYISPLCREDYTTLINSKVGIHNKFYKE